MYLRFKKMFNKKRLGKTLITDPNHYLMKTVRILKENNISFWLCHGTLLGIIREDRLLPWDHDIDFGIWKDEHSKQEILELFAEENDFEETLVPQETDSLHFSTGDKRVDLNFYSRDSKKAYIKWVAPGNSLNKLCFFINRFLVSGTSFKSIIASRSKLVWMVKIIISCFLLLIKVTLSQNLKNQLSKKLIKTINYTGYSYPIDLMVFGEIKFMGESLPVPIDFEKCLELTYGSDWRTPREDFVWHKEAKNLLSQNK